MHGNLKCVAIRYVHIYLHQTLGQIMVEYDQGSNPREVGDIGQQQQP